MAKTNGIVYGNMNLVISTKVNEREDESTALLEANFNLNKERIIAVKSIVCVDWKGKEFTIDAHDILDLDLTEFVEGA